MDNRQKADLMLTEIAQINAERDALREENKELRAALETAYAWLDRCGERAAAEYLEQHRNALARAK